MLNYFLIVGVLLNLEENRLLRYLYFLMVEKSTLWMGVILAFLGPSWVSADTPEGEIPPAWFYRAGVANEARGGGTYLLAGKVYPDRIEILSTDLKTWKFPLGKEPLFTPAPETPLVKSKPQLGVSIQFEFQEAQTQECTELIEFQTFLETLPAFSSVISNFEITAANSRQKQCALKVQEALRSRKLLSQVTVGSLPQGGILVRSVLREPKKDSSQAANDIKAKEVQTRLTLVLPGGKRVPLVLTSSGLFARSFTQNPVQAGQYFELQYESRDGYARAKLENVPFIRLGNNPIRFAEGEILQVQASNWDRLERVDTPPEIIAAALKKAKEVEGEYSLGVAALANYTAFDGTGVKGQRSTVRPFALQLSYRLDERFSIFGDVMVPFTFSDTSPNILSVGGDLVMWLKGGNPRQGEPVKNPFRLALGLGGFYFQNRLTAVMEKETKGGLLLSDLVGVYGVVRSRYHASEEVAFDFVAAVSPLPPTVVNELSISWWTSIGAEYCWKNSSCLIGQLKRERYFIDYAQVGQLDGDINSFGIGYKHFLK